MKYLLLILFCFIAGTPMATAQKIYFTDTSNRWDICFVNAGDPSHPEAYYSTCSYTGDTVIGLHRYNIMQTSYSSPYTSAFFVREDTLANKVYYINSAGDSEQVLMDYNLVRGDTFILNSIPRWVTGVDSTQIRGFFYKVWHFSLSGLNYDIIEGIGHSWLPALISAPYFSEGAPFVYCFSNQGSNPTLSPRVDYLDNATSCREFTHLSVSQPTNTLNKIKVFPNPANEIFTISISDHGPLLAALVNMVGQTITSIQVNKGATEVNTSAVPAGVYQLLIIDETGNRFSRKMTVIH